MSVPQLYDQFNRRIPALKRPDTREIAAVSVRDRWTGYPSAGLTPSRLAAIFRAADYGDVRAQAELFEEMEEKDAHLASVMATRRLAVLGLDWEINPASEDAQDQKIAEFCREQLEAVDLEDLLTHLLMAIGHGYAGAEILWRPGDRTEIRGFNLIHPKNISFYNSLSPLIVTETDSQGVVAPPWKLLYHRHAAKSGHDTRNGVLRIVGFMYLLKNYALKDWAAFNEIFGMPLRLGKYEPSATPSDKEALRAAISSLGSDAAGIISKSTEIEFVEARGRISGLSNPYQVMAFFCNRETSKAVLGQTLTTDTEGSTGTYAAGQVQENVRRDLLEADAKYLAKTVLLQLLRPLVGFNFGWDRPLPVFRFDLSVEEDLEKVAKVYLALASLGFPLTLEHVSERFGVSMPEQGQTLIKGAGPAAPAPPGDGGTGRGGDGGEGKGQGQVAAKALQVLSQAGKPVPLQLIPQDAGVIKTQEDLEALTQAAVAASAAAAATMLAPIKELIDSGATLEALRDGLLAVYPDMEVADLGELLYQARMLALMKAQVENA